MLTFIRIKEREEVKREQKDWGTNVRCFDWVFVFCFCFVFL